jgi:glucose-1-phosphate cytidylyltransferase
MKVVLFCGGLGTRLREHSDTIPKPLVNIGYRPIIWHLMRYYAHFGHKDFVLCLGYRGDLLREYFLNYNECVSNDFTLSEGGRKIDLHTSDIQDWRITFVDTGMHANIGQRLLRVRKHLAGEEMFLANYADGLTDLWLPDYIENFEHHSDAVASFLAVKPPLSFHVTEVDPDGYAQAILPIRETGIRVNGGYFAFRRAIFDHIQPGEELVIEPFQRLVAQRQLAAYRFDGFWGVMDTFKDKQALDDLYENGPAPWEVWKKGRPAPPPREPA